MYIDSVIVFSLVVIALIILMMVYIWRYARKHIDMDEKRAATNSRSLGFRKKKSHSAL